MAKRRRKSRAFHWPFVVSRRSSAFLILTAGVLIGMGVSRYQEETPHASPILESQINVCFTPGQNCTSLIVQAIGSAKSSIHVQAYSFTSPEIAQALIEAKHRGVDVNILADRSQENARHSQVRNLAAAGIPVLIDRVPGIAHNKIIIIDNKSVLCGSFNWTKAAQTRNSENLLWIHDPKMARLYLQNWRIRKANARPLQSPKMATPLP